MPVRLMRILFLVILGLAPPRPAGAQIDGRLSAYLQTNAAGYLQPVVDAFAADLNSGLFHSGHVPSHAHFSLEIKLMSVAFDDADRTFLATTEGVFDPPQTVEVPTIIGSPMEIVVPGTGGTTFQFPGGFDLNTFTIAVPQVRVGLFGGTDALVRFFAIDTGNADLGTIELFGLGVRHSLSQHMGPAFPLDIAGGVFWQSFEMGDNVVDTRAFSIGLQVSKSLALLQPYAGLSWDRFALDVHYQSNALGTPQTIDLAFASETTLHLTLGLAVNMGFLNVHGEYNQADRNSFSVGLAVGN